MDIWNIITTKEIAEKVDSVLLLATASDPMVRLSYKNKEEEYEHIAIFEQLEKMELVNNVNKYEFLVCPKGFAFIKNGGFMSMYKDKLEQSQREQRQDELTQAQINAEKRQPYLIA